MCGICGIAAKRLLDDRDVVLLGEMNAALVHRGPDSEGFYREGPVALAMRRLKIIDLEGGDQPLFSEDGMIALVVNGEIYNHVELRRELEARGHRFSSRSDCETIVHLYEEKGERCLKSLRGMFAFALFDSRRRKLFIARDRIGEKSLYYCRSSADIAFASEMKALIPWLQPRGVEVDRDAFNLYLHYGYVPEPLTAVKGVRKLPAGHFLLVDHADFSITEKKYWDLEDTEPVDGNPIELIRDAFDEVSRLIVRADVPVGVSLSGGIDSGAVAVFARRHYLEEMHAFSVGYPGRPVNDEREMAQGLARKRGLAFHDIELRADEFARFFPEMVYCMDDPVADIAAFGIYSVNRAARDHGVPVLLSGLGGDELFWGYPWVAEAVRKNLAKRAAMEGNGKYHFLAEVCRWVLANINLKQALLQPDFAAKRILAAIQRERRRLDNPNRFVFYDERPNFLAGVECNKELFPVDEQFDEGLVFSFFESTDWKDIPARICKFLFTTWLQGNCLVLSDRMSMACSVESRLPLLDHCFVELVMGLRKTMPDHDLGYKRRFIDAMRGIVPDEVLHRRKMGFTPPILEWYRAVVEMYGKRIGEGGLFSWGLVERDMLQRFVRRAVTDEGALPMVYRVVLFDIWCDRMLGGDVYGA